MGRIDMQSGAAVKGSVSKAIVLTVCTEKIVLRNPSAVYEAWPYAHCVSVSVVSVGKHGGVGTRPVPGYVVKE